MDDVCGMYALNADERAAEAGFVGGGRRMERRRRRRLDVADKVRDATLSEDAGVTMHK